jgi:glutamate synthase (NADPH/NADH) large chain
MPLPPARGLYDPHFEHDACGLGFVAELHRTPSHRIVSRALEVLSRLSHRGAAGSDPLTGDGAGILLQIPHHLYERTLIRKDIELPAPGDYGVAMGFFSRNSHEQAEEMRLLTQTVRYHNQRVMGWRDVPVDPSQLGPVGLASRPVVKQLFIGRVCEPEAFERTLFMIRKRATRLAALRGLTSFYLASCSSATIVYKGLALPERLDAFYPDLAQDDCKSSLALVHSRFSTNTFPTWERAHPYRRIAHNGEINTLRGNKNWMTAREPMLASKVFCEHIEDFKPIIAPDQSDSGSLDEVVDFLVASGRSLPHVMMMLVPEAVGADASPEVRGFFDYHAALVQPWDGPASLMFSDGKVIGAMLDRNGLRPSKYVVTTTGLVIAASEYGVVDVPPDEIAQKGRLSPGKMLLVDTVRGTVSGDDEVKRAVTSAHPYAEWVARERVLLERLPETATPAALTIHERRQLQRAFGYTREDLNVVLEPMSKNGEEPTGSMGVDAPLAVLSERPQLLFRYFKQQFAQVTNPPIDPLREALVMSLDTWLGPEGNLLEETAAQVHRLELHSPVVDEKQMAKIRRVGESSPVLRAVTLEALFDADGDVDTSLSTGVLALVAAAEAAVRGGAGILVLSDRQVSASRAAIPSLLAVSAVHQALITSGLRMRAGLMVESGEPREVADVALLVGYGASAVHPYLALAAVRAMYASESEGEAAVHKYEKAMNKGLAKVLSKMGISTLSSYHGAQIFEAIGLSTEFIQAHFAGTSSRLGGLGARDIARESLARHVPAFIGTDDVLTPGDQEPLADADALEVGGVYAFRTQGERHLWSPPTIAALQKAVRASDAASYDEYARRINDQVRGQLGERGGEESDHPYTLRGLWDIDPLEREAAPLDEVEPATKIVRRFATGAMSFGSISKEAHENLAIAMNRIGGKSNSGEGGEDAARFGGERRSAIKQVASARFGVTAHYLVNADELQIKVAQGAKPGEGGQLPGHKVDSEIARVRHSTPGVTLISPPPHHDIYSIEDLAQLIFDLKNVHPRARISVKLVSEAGVGTIAAGVAKAHADAVHIAGHDGGTGASPLSSIHHAGAPWELGLAEAQQVLVKNDLRGRVVVQVDGQLKTGRDVAIAALLGAEEFGFATAPLVASGCVMMRKCHLNTCPVGVATQDPVLRARFRGTPEDVIRYFFFVAEELRQIMATLGFRTVDEMVGQVEHLRPRNDVTHPKARLLDFSALLASPEDRSEDGRMRPRRSDPRARHLALDHAVDHRLLDGARLALKYGERTRVQVVLTNRDRAVGTMLSGEIARRYGAKGLADGTLRIEASGTAGQSLGAFLAPGVEIRLVGDANDYVGKGLSGGVISVRPPEETGYVSSDNSIVGNTVLYGATSGRAFFAGRAGERFAVRNSGAVAVCEGVGDHGCEYMTGGLVVVLGPTGRNFGAGMSGGVAYVEDADGAFRSRVNPASVELDALTAADEKELRAIIEEHVTRTHSVKGANLLARFDPASFLKVVPTEYRKVLLARVAEREAQDWQGEPGVPAAEPTRLEVLRG